MMIKQEQFKLAPEEGAGEDENGAFKMIPLSMVRGGELKPTKVHTQPIKHIINTSNPSPRGWYKSKHEPKRVRPRPCYTEALLTTPYGGFCHIGCKFCYVDHGTRGYRATGLATASPTYPDAIRKQIAQMQVCPAAYISSFTEPFQLLEKRHHITQRLAQVFIDERLPLFFLSRAIPPEWAVEALLQNPYSYMQWSINSSNTATYKRLSPGSYTIEDVMASMRQISDLGIFISIQCNPVLPGIVSLDDLQNLVRLVAENGGHHIIFKFVEQVFNNRKLLIDRLSKIKGVDTLDSLLNQRIGGVYTIQQDVRIEWLQALLQTTRDCGITMSTCYEYYDDGAAGSNMAPWFTTSDQCHGRGVPMHYRPEPGAKFQPFPCYRKGCLYCEDFGTKACRNAELLQAKALTYKDYRSIVIEEPDGGWDWRVGDSCVYPYDMTNGLDWHSNPNLMTDAELWGLDAPWE